MRGGEVCKRFLLFFSIRACVTTSLSTVTSLNCHLFSLSFSLSLFSLSSLSLLSQLSPLLSLFSLSLFSFSLFSLSLLSLSSLKKTQLPASIGGSSDPKLVVDGTWGPQLPRGAGPLSSRTPPNLAAKVASLRSAFNTSQPRLLPNVSGVLAAIRSAKAGNSSLFGSGSNPDLGLQQNLRRAGGQALDAAAGAVEGAKSFGDSILFWNEVSTEVYANAATTGEQPGPVLGARALSIVHLSMYDAYAGARGNPADLPKYLPQLEPASVAAQASPKAAVAGAAYEALLHLYPMQKAFLDAKLLSFCDGAKGYVFLSFLFFSFSLFLFLFFLSWSFFFFAERGKNKNKLIPRPLSLSLSLPKNNKNKNTTQTVGPRRLAALSRLRRLRRQLDPPPKSQRPPDQHRRALRSVHAPGLVRGQRRIPLPARPRHAQRGALRSLLWRDGASLCRDTALHDRPGRLVRARRVRGPQQRLHRAVDLWDRFVPERDQPRQRDFLP